jgi:hypothetical protein
VSGGLGGRLARRPRLAAALAFGLAGAALPASWYLPVVARARNPLLGFLFVGIPGLAAAAAAALLAADGVRSAVRAAGRGAAIAALALLLFAPSFAVLYAWTAPPREHVSIMGFTILLLTGAVLAALWIAAAIGALIGIALFGLRPRDRGA